MILFFFIIFIILILFTLKEKFSNNCEFIPFGRNFNECRNYCNQFSEQLGLEACTHHNCILKCKNCINKKHCKWLHKRQRRKQRNVLRDQKIHITNNSMYNPIRKKITLEWKVRQLNPREIKKQMKYDDEETRLNKIVSLKNLYRSDDKCDSNSSADRCNYLNNLLKPMKGIHSSSKFKIKDDIDTLIDKTYLCKKPTNPNLFYIFVSSSQDRANANLVYIYNSNKDNLDTENLDTHKFDICIDEKKSDCKLRLPSNLDYIFYISSFDKQISSNVKVISTR